MQEGGKERGRKRGRESVPYTNLATSPLTTTTKRETTTKPKRQTIQQRSKGGARERELQRVGD